VEIKKITFKILKIASIIIGVILALIIIIIILINGLYKEKIIKYTINELNNQLNVPVNVKYIDLSFWKTFPNASIEFDEVLIKSSNKNSVSVGPEAASG